MRDLRGLNTIYMTLEQLVEELTQVEPRAPRGKLVASYQVFGIKHVDDLTLLGLKKVCEDAKVSDMAYIEIRRGMNLAPYVELIKDLPTT